MARNTTLDQLSSFARNEKKLLKEVGLTQQESIGPEKETVDFILNFSKAYSARKSKNLGVVENLLN